MHVDHCRISMHVLLLVQEAHKPFFLVKFGGHLPEGHGLSKCHDNVREFSASGMLAALVGVDAVSFVRPKQMDMPDEP